jgi:hypothetical protein
MLSVRLPQVLENQLATFCAAQGVTKSSVVQLALARYLASADHPSHDIAVENPFEELCGIGNRKLTTDQIMQLMRGTK